MEYNLKFIIYFLLFNLLFYQLFFLDKKIINELDQKSLLITNLNYSILSSCLFDNFTTKFINILRDFNKFRYIFRLITKSENTNESILYDKNYEKENIFNESILYENYLIIKNIILNKKINIKNNILKRIQVEGDGNCFYRCIAQKLYNDQNNYKKIKIKFINFFKENKIGFKRLNDSMRIKIKNMKISDNEFADEPIIKETRKIFNVNLIILYNSDKDNMKVCYGFDFVDMRIESIVLKFCKYREELYREEYRYKREEFNHYDLFILNVSEKKMRSQ